MADTPSEYTSWIEATTVIPEPEVSTALADSYRLVQKFRNRPRPIPRR